MAWFAIIITVLAASGNNVGKVLQKQVRPCVGAVTAWAGQAEARAWAMSGGSHLVAVNASARGRERCDWDRCDWKEGGAWLVNAHAC
jgi:hypothetical protein